MLGVEGIIYTYATITCDWPGCSNRISLQAGPEDIDRQAKDLRSLRNLAKRRGWSIKQGGQVTDCPDHNRKESE